MSKDKKPRFVLSLSEHPQMNRLKFRAVIRENIKSGLAKGANVYRIGTFGATEAEAVSNLGKCVRANCFEDKARSKMLAACDQWLVQNAETYTPTEASICGVDKHNAQNAASNPEHISASFLRNQDLQKDAKIVTDNLSEGFALAAFTRLVLGLTDREKEAAPEIAKAEWFIITKAGKEVQSGKVPTQWGEVRVSLGECGEPGGAFEGKECAAFSFWFEGWEYYREYTPMHASDLQVAENTARSVAKYAANGGQVIIKR